MYYIEGRGAFSPLPHSSEHDRMWLDAYYPAHRYLTISVPLTPCTEILRFAQDDKWAAGGRIWYSAPYLNDRKQPAAMSFRAELHAGMGGKGFRLIETLSREISGRYGAPYH